MTQDELKACPFCGCTVIEYSNDTGPNDEGFWEWYECTKCGAKCDSVAEWNTRVDTEAAKPEGKTMTQIDVLTLRIRDDHTVQIGGIPTDLTQAEADLVCKRIMAHATPSDAAKPPVGGDVVERVFEAMKPCLPMEVDGNIYSAAEAAIRARDSTPSAELEAGGWQPIETAPKSETLLLIDGFNRVGIGQLYGEASTPQANVGGAGWAVCGALGNMRNGFTHWMPLPPPPKGAPHD